MGAWAELTIELDRLKGLAEPRLLDRGLGSVDPNVVTGALTVSAKALLRTKLIDRKVGALGVYVSGYASLEAFLDALAGAPALQDQLQDLLALAFLRVYLRQKRNGPSDVWAEDAEEFENDLNSAVRAFAELAPNAIAQRNRTGPVPGGALYSTMSTYDS